MGRSRGLGFAGGRGGPAAYDIRVIGVLPPRDAGAIRLHGLVVTLKVGDSLVVSESLFFAFFQKFISCHRGLRRPGSRFPIPRQGHKRIFERSSGPRAPLPGPLRPPHPARGRGGAPRGLSLTPRAEIRGGVQMAEIWPTHGPTAPTDTQTNIRKHRTGGGVPMGGGLEFNSWGIFLGFWAYYVTRLRGYGPIWAVRGLSTRP